MEGYGLFTSAFGGIADMAGLTHFKSVRRCNDAHDGLSVASFQCGFLSPL
jgi:hypothetical protein